MLYRPWPWMVYDHVESTIKDCMYIAPENQYERCLRSTFRPFTGDKMNLVMKKMQFSIFGRLTAHDHGKNQIHGLLFFQNFACLTSFYAPDHMPTETLRPLKSYLILAMGYNIHS